MEYHCTNCGYIRSGPDTDITFSSIFDIISKLCPKCFFLCQYQVRYFNDECSICYSHSNHKIVYECRHWICNDCFMINESAKCSICRMNSIDVHEITIRENQFIYPEIYYGYYKKLYAICRAMSINKYDEHLLHESILKLITNCHKWFYTKTGSIILDIFITIYDHYNMSEVYTETKNLMTYNLEQYRTELTFIFNQVKDNHRITESNKRIINQRLIKGINLTKKLSISQDQIKQLQDLVVSDSWTQDLDLQPIKHFRDYRPSWHSMDFKERSVLGRMKIIPFFNEPLENDYLVDRRFKPPIELPVDNIHEELSQILARIDREFTNN